MQCDTLFDGVKLQDYPAVFAKFKAECESTLWYREFASMPEKVDVSRMSADQVDLYRCYQLCQHSVVYNDKYDYVSWYKNGKLHRDGDNPAVIYAIGTRKWYKNGELHRDDDKPAIIYYDGTRQWYKNGKLDRNHMTALIWDDEMLQWWKKYR